MLIVANWVLATEILLECAAAKDLLHAADANWQDQYDSGTMAFASLPVGFGLLPPALAAFAALTALAIRRLRSTALGWTSLVAHLALLVAIWNGPAAPGSSTDYWVRLAASEATRDPRSPTGDGVGTQPSGDRDTARGASPRAGRART